MIMNAHRSPLGEFKGFIVEGKLRIGKTVYSIKVMRDLFMMLNPNLTKEEAYELALQYINFEIDPFLTLIENKQRETRKQLPHIDWTTRIPVVTLDDASLYAGADLYIKDQAIYSAFQNTMTTIGTAASSVIITAPSHLALTKCLREYYSYYVVKITKYDEYRREAKIMEWYEDRGRQKMKLREVGTDEFTAHVPDAVYAKYLYPRLEKGETTTRSAREISAARKREVSEIREVASEVLEASQPRKTTQRKKRVIYGSHSRPDLTNATPSPSSSPSPETPSEHS